MRIMRTEAAAVRNGKQYNPYLVDTQPGDSAEQEHIRPSQVSDDGAHVQPRRYGTAQLIFSAYLMRSGAIQTNVGEGCIS
jgi:hypothetical protein